MLIVRAHNDGTGSNKGANYDVEISINNYVIASGRVTGHDRALGWRQLLMMIAAMPTDAEVLHTVNEIIKKA